MQAPSDLVSRIVDGLNGIQSGDGWKCFCPAHEDTVRSLSVSTGENGKLVFYCHAHRCSFESIVSALRNRGLMPEKKSGLVDASLKVIATYDYRNEHGELLFEKIRKEGKKFFLRRRGADGNWIYKQATAGLKTIPLYRLPELIKGVENGSTICITEGEKDADALSRLGFVATCNFDGAGKWRACYNAFLARGTVVIFEDNDEPGRQHGERIGRALLPVARSVRVVRFTGAADKSDVSDHLAAFGTDDEKKAAVEALIEGAAPFQVDEALDLPVEVAKKKKIERAVYPDYVALFESVLNKPRRDVFSEKLMTREQRSGLWVPARNKLKVLRSRAKRLEEIGHPEFSRSLVEDHLADYEEGLTPEILFDVPPWDGRDRIKEFASALILNDRAGLGDFDCEEFVKDWLARAWRRVHDATVQNRILILQGDQGIGKDTWIDSLVGGAGQFASDLAIMAGDKDSYLQLSRGMFLKIGEFDKTARTEVSVIKDMITKSGTDLRAPYDADAQRRPVRCSFISSCNVRDILRDPTGSRRYLIFEVVRIEFSYPRSAAHSAQVLAQAAVLARDRFVASDGAERAMKGYRDERTPDDPGEEVCELFQRYLREKIAQLGPYEQERIRKRGWIPCGDCEDVLERVRRVTEQKRRTIQMMLKPAFGVRDMSQRGYRVLPDMTEDRSLLTDLDDTSVTPF